MGKLSQTLQSSVGSVMCGTKYQKFAEDDFEEVLGSGSTSSTSVFRKKMVKSKANEVTVNVSCPSCGHRGLIKESTHVSNGNRSPEILNNSNPTAKLVTSRSTSDLLSAASKSTNLKCLRNNLKSELDIQNGCKSTEVIISKEKRMSHEDRMLAMTDLILRNSATSDETRLREAAWFQPGLSRNISTEVLRDSSVGSFLVRCSETRPDAFALSLKAPNLSIVHYLIISNKFGWRIKGSAKCFSSLLTLITHHSVMSELLPCPLKMIGYGTTLIARQESKQTKDDFADIDLADYPDLLFTLRQTFGSNTEDSLSNGTLSDECSISSSI